ncbi:MAG: sugar phosphate nucleotidyltransferase [Gammaproteobacteria bacterium]|jgi:choline kinase
MKAIILSAGQGKRLLPLTAKQPKAAIKIQGKSVLEWQLQELSKCAIKDVLVVTGFGADKIDSIVRKQNFITARTLYNPFYLQSDNLGTCWIARHEMELPFMLINGDTLFEAAIVGQLLGSKNESEITLVTDSKDIYDDDDMKIILEKDHISKIGKTIDRSKVDAESIGMMCFGAKGASTFIEQLNTMMRADGGLQMWYLSAINAIAQSNKVATCPIDGLHWCEIDSHEDLNIAEKKVATW